MGQSFFIEDSSDPREVTVTWSRPIHAGLGPHYHPGAHNSSRIHRDQAYPPRRPRQRRPHGVGYNPAVWPPASYDLGCRPERRWVGVDVGIVPEQTARKNQEPRIKKSWGNCSKWLRKAKVSHAYRARWMLGLVNYFARVSAWTHLAVKSSSHE
jgi:hypothetical protein